MLEPGTAVRFPVTRKRRADESPRNLGVQLQATGSTRTQVGWIALHSCSFSRDTLP